MILPKYRRIISFTNEILHIFVKYLVLHKKFREISSNIRRILPKGPPLISWHALGSHQCPHARKTSALIKELASQVLRLAVRSEEILPDMSESRWFSPLQQILILRNDFTAILRKPFRISGNFNAWLVLQNEISWNFEHFPSQKFAKFFFFSQNYETKILRNFVCFVEKMCPRTIFWDPWSLKINRRRNTMSLVWYVPGILHHICVLYNA